MEYIYCAVLGYWIGSFNPAYILAKSRGIDIRENGSKNAGASNALILFGKVRGILCAVLDILKAYFAILLTGWLMPAFAQSFAVTAAACVLGHIFPFYMGFRGGKGTACLGGIILAYDWRLALLMLVAEVALAFITDYICVVPISASIAFPLIYGFGKPDALGGAILAVITAVMLLKHIENLRRIRAGTEMRLRFLWKPDAELKRMQQNLPEAGHHGSGWEEGCS